MVSNEAAKGRKLWEGFVESLTPPEGVSFTVEEQRAGFDEWATRSMPVPADTELETVDAGGVSAIWTRAPGTSRERTIIYFHGGGYVLGSATAYRGFGAALSAAADAQILIVDYSRAPEYPHPAALNDSLSAYRWLITQGIPASSIVLAGDSAGGGLTAAALIALRDAGEELPAGGVCLSPWVDMTFSGKSYDTRLAEDPVISRELLGSMAQLWLGQQDAKDAKASPIFANLAGLPPMQVYIGTAECLYDEAVEFHEKLQANGVDTSLHVGDEMFHIWPVMSSFLPEAQHATAQIGAFVRQRVNAPTTV